MPRTNAIRDLPSPTAYVPPKLVPVKPPLARARATEDDAVPKFRIPTPEELGIGTPIAMSGQETLDWDMVDRQLERLGAMAHQLERTSTGHTFTIRLPKSVVTGHGKTKREAIQEAFRNAGKSS